MACDNEIKEGLDNLAASLLEGLQAVASALPNSTGGCGCPGIPGSEHGSAGGGVNTATPSGNSGQYGNPESPPLPGFPDKASSDAYQCSMANRIMDDLLHDISVLTTLSVAGILATELAAIMVPLLFTPLAWVDLLLLCAIVIQAFVVGMSYSLVITHLEENRSEYICALLDGSNVSGSISSFKAKVEELMPLDPVIGANSLFVYIATTLVNSYITYDNINRLYDKVDYTLPPADCSDCGPDIGDYTVNDGTEISSHPANPIDIQTETISGCEIVDIAFHVPVTITTVTYGLGGSVCMGNFVYNSWSDENATSGYYGSNTAPQSDPNNQSGRRRLRIATQDADTLHITYSLD